MTDVMFGESNGDDCFVYFNTKIEWIRSLFDERRFSSKFCIDPSESGTGVRFAFLDKVICPDDVPESLIVQLKVKYHQLISFVAAFCIDAYFCYEKHNCKVCVKRDWYDNIGNVQTFDYLCCQDEILFANVGISCLVVSNACSAQIIKKLQGSILDLKRIPVEVREDMFR